MYHERNTALIAALTSTEVMDDATIGRASQAAEKAGRKLEDSLIELGLLKEDDLAKFLSDWLKVELVKDTSLNLAPGTYSDRDLEYFRRAKVAPYQSEAGCVHLAMRDPRDEEILQVLEFHLGVRVEAAVAAPRTIEHILDRLTPEAEADLVDIVDADVEKLLASANDGPIVQLMASLITDAVDVGASDIHIEASEVGGQVRYRQDGILRLIKELSTSELIKGVSRLKVMASLNISERRRPQDGRIRMVIRGRNVDFRLSTLPSQHGESVVMRVLDRTQVDLEWAALGFTEKRISDLERIIRQPNGIILVTGPVGSGKTTTLYTAISKLNTPEKKIISVEDPVEYALPGITQVQVQPDIGLTFAAALRSVLRQDLDIAMIGEIRDEETAENAVRAALIGRLVLSTVHTNDAVSAISRMINLGIAPYLLSETLRGVVSQRLLRRICKSCKGDGCKDCGETGTKGRVVVSEFLEITPDIRKLVARDAPSGEVLEAARDDGFQTIQDEAAERVSDRQVSGAEVRRVLG